LVGQKRFKAARTPTPAVAGKRAHIAATQVNANLLSSGL
jgi:hypothetical protein